MYSIGFVMKVRPGCYDEYKKAHDELWPDVAQSMADNQVRMSIFLYQDILFLHAVAPSETDWDQSRQHPALKGWRDYMATLLQPDASGDVFFAQIPETFAFGMFKR